MVNLIVIPTGMPGPDGKVRDYPVYLDSYDLLYGDKEAFKSLAVIVPHFNKIAEKENQSHRVSVSDDGMSLEWMFMKEESE